MIGYLIERQLMNVLPGGALVAALLTQVRVDRRDPAFRKPGKPIGATYAESEARALAAERGWRVAANADGWQRVVASPAPLEILEARLIELLVEQNVIVICTGGGGIAVIELGWQPDRDRGRDRQGWRQCASCLSAPHRLAGDAHRRRCALSRLGYGNGPGCQACDSARATWDFAPGSMRPKVHVACGFVNKTGKRAGIGALRDASAIIEGAAGTIISADAGQLDDPGWQHGRMITRLQPRR